ncbi:type II secretion system protein [Pseudoclavibacter sp. CFCC 11306]|uniref:type II secretion system protein n=1 Tax=Pseudoclavibacter sp. CFCC 11306 TaxID=1564493 RepID=UPI001301575E|nr:prepilin-type N-terminal cleavage/methylation domain-containing protein [Pseudoclavibacter sp. CFCC 11306]
MTRTQSKKTNSTDGFTLVELLVVIVVIAILATVSLVAYNGIQQRARESRVALQLTQLRKKMEMYRIEHGEWPFQAKMDEEIARGSGAAGAWCSAAHDYIRQTGADSGASPSGIVWLTTCTGTYSSQGGVVTGWKGCAGFSVTQVWPDDAKMLYISSDKLGVSPAFADVEGSLAPASNWCVK